LKILGFVRYINDEWTQAHLLGIGDTIQLQPDSFDNYSNFSSSIQEDDIFELWCQEGNNFELLSSEFPTFDNINWYARIATVSVSSIERNDNDVITMLTFTITEVFNELYLRRGAEDEGAEYNPEENGKFEYLEKKTANRDTVLVKISDELKRAIKNEIEVFEDEDKIEIKGINVDGTVCKCKSQIFMRTYESDVSAVGSMQLTKLNFVIPPETECNIDLNLKVDEPEGIFGFIVNSNIKNIQFPHYQENHYEPTELTINSRYKAITTDKYEFATFTIENLNNTDFTIKEFSGITVYIKGETPLLDTIEVFGDLSNCGFSVAGSGIPTENNLIDVFNDLSLK
jgi:hypothetical protein